METETMDQRRAESQLNVVIAILLETASDTNDTVRFSVHNALRKIARKHPNEFLKTTCMYRARNTKLSPEHVSALVQPMETVCQENVVAIDGDTVLLLIQFCVDEMTRSAEEMRSVQMPASGVLVALGKKHCIQVVEGLLKKFNAGTPPHYTIPYTIGTLASANPYGVLPFLKNILGTMLPMLGMVKTDLLRQAFAYALGRFSEAITEYMSNIASAPDPTIQRELFETEMGLAFDVLCTHWLQSRDPKLTETVLQALGPMYAILTVAKVTDQTHKMISTLLLMCKRQKDCYWVTQCLASVLLVALRTHTLLVESDLEVVLNTLSDIIVPMPDYVRPDTVKNQAEVLRCYGLLAAHFCNRTTDHLLQMLRPNNSNERDRIKALLVFKHLVDVSDTAIKSRVSDVVRALKQMLTSETSLKVKLVLLKTIVPFAYHGHFSSTDCHVFVEFIIKLCCIQIGVNSKGVPDLTVEEHNELIRMCDNSLYLLTTSVLELENVFWNLFLQSVLSKDYTEAFCTLLRCLTNLAARKRVQNIGETLDCSISVAVLTRCFTLLATPCVSNRVSNRGVCILNFLKSYGWCVDKRVPTLWDLKIPVLLKHLDEEIQSWDDHVLELLTGTIREINAANWTELIVKKFTEQVPLYQAQSEEKRFLLKCLAVSLCECSDGKVVSDNFDYLLGSARFNSANESKWCAESVGICARVHLQLVLAKLNQIQRDELLKKSSKFLNFNFMKDAKHEVGVEKLRYTLIACYAEVALQAPAEKLLLTIENEILLWLVRELNAAKDFQTRRMCIFAIGRVADAMHPTRNTLHIRMQSRDSVLQLILSQLQLHNGPEYVQLYPTILPVLTSLVKLPSDVEPDQRVNILRTCFDVIYNAAAIYCKINETSYHSSDVSYGDLKLAPFVFNSFDELCALTRAFLFASMNPATLDDVLTLLESWLHKKKPEQKLPAMDNLRSVLECYLVHMKFAYEAPSKFGQTGFILGRIIPRCTDPNTTIRLVALDCVRYVLCIAARYEGHMSDYNTEISNQLLALKDSLTSPDPKQLLAFTNNMTRIIADYLPPIQLMHFVDSLLDGLLDAESASSSGASVTLNVVFTLKGGELYQHVNDIVAKLVQCMNGMTCMKTRATSVRAVLALAVHHAKPVVTVLLTNPLPYDHCVSECWKTLAQDTTLALDIIEQFKRLFNTIPLYEEQQIAERLRITTIQPLAAVCALREMFRNNQMHEIVTEQLAELLAILLMIFSSYIGTSPPIYFPQHQSTSTKKDKYSIVPNRDAYKLVPAKVALDTMKMLLLCANCDRVAEVFLQGASLESCTDLGPLVDIMPAFAEFVFDNVPGIVAKFVAVLNKYATSSVDAQRIVANAFFVEVIKHRGNGQPFLVETVITTLLNSQTDDCAMVRQLSIRGLGHLSTLTDAQISKHCNFVFTSLMQGLDDQDDVGNPTTNIPLEAMQAFSKMLHCDIDEKQLESVQVSVAVRIRRFYETGNAELRSAAFRLFGDLAKSFRVDGNGAHADAFKEQVNGNFICLLLHLSDEDVEVVKACKYTLRQISPFLDAKNVNTMIQDHLIEIANLHYLDFITDLIKIMVDELSDHFPIFIMNALSFVKSQWPVIRGNAALIVGLLYTNLPSNCATIENIQIDTVCYRLMQLLQDENADVRAKAVQGLSYLFIS